LKIEARVLNIALVIRRTVRHHNGRFRYSPDNIYSRPTDTIQNNLRFFVY